MTCWVARHPSAVSLGAKVPFAITYVCPPSGDLPDLGFELESTFISHLGPEEFLLVDLLGSLIKFKLAL